MGIFAICQVQQYIENNVKKNTLVEPSHFVENIPGMTIIIITFNRMSS